MSSGWLGRPGRRRALWLLLMSVAAAAAWAITQQLKAPVTWRVVAATAAVVVPLCIAAVTEWSKQDDDRSRMYRANLRLYSRRRGVPAVGEVRDLTLLNVTPSRGHGGKSELPPYVARDRDGKLDQLLDQNVFVLLIGDSKAGKSRMAAEAIRRKFPERRLIFPDTADSLATLLDTDFDFHNSVVWLDELQRYLDKTGLPRLLDYLMGPEAPTAVTAIATIREQAYEEHIPHGRLESPYWPTLRRAARLRIDRKFSEAERKKAEELLTDPRLLSALDRYGLAEYISAGPDLVEKLETGMISEPVGAAAVLMAADWSRAGLNRPIPRDVLTTLVANYVAESGMSRPTSRQMAKAVAWAQDPVYAASSLLSAGTSGYIAFDYVAEHIDVQLRSSVPDTVWTAALTSVRDGEEALRIGIAAFEQSRDDIAVQAFAIAVQDTEQVDRALAAYNYALMLERLERTAEAEEYYGNAAEAGHADAAYAAGRLSQARGATSEAEHFYKLGAQAGAPESAFALGMLLQEREPDEALRWLGQAAEAGHVEAAYAAGRLSQARGQTSEADRFYRLAARAGNTGTLERIAAHRIQPDRRARGTGRALRPYEAIVEPVNALEEVMSACSDAELRQLTDSFRRRLADGQHLDDLLPEAFATVREVTRRVCGFHCFDVQLVGGAALHHGRIASMRPGEGRSVTAILPSYLNALTGDAVHVVSGSAATASRDAERLGRVHQFLGLQAGLIVENMTGEAARVAYAADVTYGHLGAFAFDYLRDNMAWGPEECRQRGRHFAILDDADALLLDNPTQPFDMTGEAEKVSPWPEEFAAIADSLTAGIHYKVDKTARRAEMTEEGIARVEAQLRVDNLYTEQNTSLTFYLDAALRAKELYQRDKHYVISGDQVLVIDELTGSIRPGNRFSDGMHQAIEAKEHLRVSGERQLLARITQWAYFKTYEKLAGTAGTTSFDPAAFRSLYGLTVVQIPAHRPVNRVDHDDRVYAADAARWSDLAGQVAERHAIGQPVLVDVSSNDRAEKLSAILRSQGIPHQVLTTRNREREAEVMGACARKGAVTIATNAHRSRIDIPLGGTDARPQDRDDVIALGGLAVMGSERHRSRRDDDRLRDQAARRGEPGESLFMLCQGDPLAEAIKWKMVSFAGDGPFAGKLLNRALASLQSMIAEADLRNQKLGMDFDNVAEEQRRTIYALRDKALEGIGTNELTESYLHETISAYVDRAALPGRRPVYDMEALNKALVKLCGGRIDRPALESGQRGAAEQADIATRDDLVRLATDAALVVWEARIAELGEEVWYELGRRVLLSVIDRNWREHLVALTNLREGSELGTLKGLDPLMHYRREADELFHVLIASIKEETADYLMNLVVEVTDNPVTSPD